MPRHTARVVGTVPLIVTENGIATDDDTRRIAYTSGALAELAAAPADGIDVRGYLHSSLLDNYERGSYGPTFGPIAVDRRPSPVPPKPSAKWLGPPVDGNGPVRPRIRADRRGCGGPPAGSA